MSSADPFPASDKSRSVRVISPAYLLVSVMGVCGFVGLLVASHDVPGLATPLRISAFAWFLCVGLLRAALVRRR